MNFCMEFDDTSFIGLINAEKYKSFVDENWELDSLFQHFSNEMQKRNILVFQMTEEGIEHSWNVKVKIGKEVAIEQYFRKAVGYIRVTANQLYVADYSCLTMAAQFKDKRVPDENCSNYKIDIEEGNYKVNIIQFYNADKDEHIGEDKNDILLNFIKISDFQATAGDVFWCSY